MVWLKYACFLGIILVAVASKAEAAEVALSDSACVCNPRLHDRFEEPKKFGFGRFKDQCVDSCRFRRAILLSENKTGVQKVANILHDNVYWTGEIPSGEVTEVDIVFEKFLTGVSHVALRFRFPLNHPIVLTAQTGRSSQNQRIENLIISAEGVPPRAHPYDFVESSTGNYLFADRLLSLQQTIRWMVVLKKHSVSQYRLQLGSKQREQLLLTSLRKSMNGSFKASYSLFSRNCATEAMDSIDVPTAYSPNFLDWLSLTNLQRALPIDFPFGTLHVLENRHLISEQLPNLEEESLEKASQKRLPEHRSEPANIL